VSAGLWATVNAETVAMRWANQLDHLSPSAQSAASNGPSGIGTNLNINTTNFGAAAPDMVANLRVDQNWGSAQISGVAHQVHVHPTGGGALRWTIWGWAVNSGVTFRLPN